MVPISVYLCMDLTRQLPSGLSVFLTSLDAEFSLFPPNPSPIIARIIVSPPLVSYTAEWTMSLSSCRPSFHLSSINLLDE